MKKDKRHFFSYILQSKVFFILLLCIVIVSAVRLSNEIARRISFTKQISALRAQVDELRSERDALSDLMTSLSTDSYIEEAARKKLNMAKPGEQVIVVPIQGAVESGSEQVKPEIVSTPVLWWDYFFGEHVI